MKNDLLLQLDVVAELDRELHAAANGIGIEVHHGTVKLAGHIGSAAAKGNAEGAAQRVRGVTAVILDIDVTEEGSTEPLKELKYVKDDKGAKALCNEWLGIPARRF